MKKVNMLSGEAGKLTAVSRALRCKIQDSEKEEKDLLRRKGNTIKEIADMQEKKSKLSLEIKDKTQELAEITKKAKAEVRAILDNLSSLKSAERNNQKALDEINRKREEFDKYALSVRILCLVKQ